MDVQSYREKTPKLSQTRGEPATLTIARPTSIPNQKIHLSISNFFTVLMQSPLQLLCWPRLSPNFPSEVRTLT